MLWTWRSRSGRDLECVRAERLKRDAELVPLEGTRGPFKVVITMVERQKL
jgi:hypothetical protein